MKEAAYVSDTINLNDTVYPPDPSNIMAYAFAYVDNVTAAPLQVDIACASDDGISVLLNGTVVHANDACRGFGGSGEVQDRAPATLAVGKNLLVVKCFEEGGGWGFRLRLESRGTGTPIVSKNRIQITTDPDLGLLFGGGGTPILPVDGGGDPDPPPDVDPRELFESPVVINEGFLSASEEPWIELYNRTDTAYDLSDHRNVTNDPRDLTRATLPAGTSVPARGFLVLTATELGLDLTPLVIEQVQENRFVALVKPGAEGILDAANFNPSYPGTTEARVPDGDWEFRDGADRTPGEANRVTLPYQVIINEIMYHPIDGDDDKEYVELSNPGGVDVDLSGSAFTQGLSYTFERRAPRFPRGAASWWPAIRRGSGASTASAPTRWSARWTRRPRSRSGGYATRASGSR